MAGGIVSSLAFAASTFSPNVPTLMVTYGVLGETQFLLFLSTVQVRKLVDRKLQTPLFSSFLKGDFFHLKIKSWHPIKVHE